MRLADRLRALADALPEGGSVTFTRADLLAMLAEDGEPSGRQGAAPLMDLTVDDIMEATGRARSTVCGWIAAGQLRAYRFGREWRIPHEAWREFLDRHRTGEPAGHAPAPRPAPDLSAWRRHLARRS